MPKKMHLAIDISYTHLDGRWRMPGSWTNRIYPDLDLYEEMARIAERGLFDMLFFGDGTGIPDNWAGNRDEAVRWGIGWPRHDMSPVATAMTIVNARTPPLIPTSASRGIPLSIPLSTLTIP